MTSDGVVNLLRLLEESGVEVWLDGGWAVDAALGEQARAHQDLDIIVRRSQLDALQELLEREGFSRQLGGTDSNVVYSDSSGREVDIHAVEFDRDGNGVFEMEDGSDWVLPAAGFRWSGVVGTLRVRCLSPEVQVLCHAQGYTPTEKDFRDMELLQERFGVTLPPQLQRPARRERHSSGREPEQPERRP